MSQIEEVRRGIIAKLYELDELTVLQNLARIVEKETEEEEPETIVEAIDFYAPLLDQLPKSKTIDELIEEQGVEESSPEKWAEFADLYSDIPEEHIREFLRID